MKKCLSVVGLLLALAGAQTAAAQTAPPPATSAPKPASAGAYRYGGISGGWLTPSGDFDKIAGSGWSIVVDGYQFINPSKKIAVGSQIGYYSFAEKNNVTISNFPVDLLLKFFPKADEGKLRLYGTGGIGFNYFRTEVGRSSTSDYEFGTQAGAGVELHGDGPVALMVDATYHWIYTSGTDANFVSLRAGILVPMTR